MLMYRNILKYCKYIDLSANLKTILDKGRFLNMGTKTSHRLIIYFIKDLMLSAVNNT